MSANASDSARLLEALEAHYETYLGPARGLAEWSLSRGRIELRRYEPVPGVLVLSTFGVSTLQSPPREAVLSLPADPPESILASACHMCGAWAERSLAVAEPRCIDGEGLGDTDFDVLLALPPTGFTEGLATLQAPSTPLPLVVRWLVPAYREEAEYREAHGPAALLDLLRAQRLDPTDFSRGPASTLITPEDAARLAGTEGPASGYKVEHNRGGIRIERRRKRIGRPEEATARIPIAPRDAAPPLSRAAQPSPKPHLAPERNAAGASRSPRARFELDGPAMSPPSGPSQSSRPASVPRPPPLAESPEAAKRRRIEALKAKARAARVRAEARARGEAPEVEAETALPPAKPELPRKQSLAAAERRRRRIGGPAKPRRR